MKAVSRSLAAKLKALGQTLITLADCEELRAKAERKIITRNPPASISEFIRTQVEPDLHGPGVGARQMYISYHEWCKAFSIIPETETKFGRDVKLIIQRRHGRKGSRYLGVRLRITDPA